MYMFLPFFSLENKLLVYIKPPFLPVEELEPSELKTPLVYTFFPSDRCLPAKNLDRTVLRLISATIHFSLFTGEWFTDLLFIHGFFPQKDGSFCPFTHSLGNHRQMLHSFTPFTRIVATKELQRYEALTAKVVSGVPPANQTKETAKTQKFI